MKTEGIKLDSDALMPILQKHRPSVEPYGLMTMAVIDPEFYVEAASRILAELLG
ncbi:hypothetical protein [Ktedonospora formicarum]|uniref:Uncharacterized protein n=1 Tax=Ktedonospora formicarum TaxID=2778364 RepID=A0A8J3IG63_9CHLR|nr:hypothetical protein [Ktedonospora formicarum]GHO51259.1 hypothetical protein KSX_94220 [Ktedonospora formicarum]